LQRALLDHVVLEEVLGVRDVDRVRLCQRAVEQCVVRRGLHLDLEAEVLGRLLAISMIAL
jgi:hypothetical protein